MTTRGMESRTRSKTENDVGRIKREATEFERAVHVPREFSRIYRRGKNCPSLTCHVRLKNVFILRSHWKRTHIKVVPYYDCLLGKCSFSSKYPSELMNHFNKKHPHCSDRDGFSKVTFKINENYEKPILPPADTRRKIVTSKRKRVREGNNTEMNEVDDTNVSLASLSKYFVSGRGCPSVGCSGKFRKYNMYGFQSHWEYTHQKTVSYFKCPIASCKRQLKSWTIYQGHMLKFHPEFPVQFSGVKIVNRENEHYVKPVLPEKRAGKKRSTLAKKRAPNRSTVRSCNVAPSLVDVSDRESDPESSPSSVSQPKPTTSLERAIDSGPDKQPIAEGDSNPCEITALRSDITSVLKKQAEILEKIQHIECHHLIVQKQSHCLISTMDEVALSCARMEQYLSRANQGPATQEQMTQEKETAMEYGSSADQSSAPKIIEHLGLYKGMEICKVEVPNATIKFMYTSPKDLSAKLRFMNILGQDPE